MIIKKLNLARLNKTEWFKYVKNLYIILFAISISVTAADSFSIFKPKLDPERSYLSCAETGQKVPLGEHNISIVNGSIAAADQAKARRLCMTDAQVGAMARAQQFFLANDTQSDEELGKQIRSENNFVYQNMYMNITPTEQNYELTNVYVKKNIFAMVLWFLIPSLLIVMIFEAIRRTFYYVVLDTFNPEKATRYASFKLKS
jgi:hypothetical protein